jgi:hypothetical protein
MKIDPGALVIMSPLLNQRTCNKASDLERLKVWRIIRGLRDYTISEVALLASVSEHIVRTYNFSLYRAGYVSVAGRRKNEAGVKKAAWRLIRNTGPEAPQQICCMLDTNLQTVAAAEKEKSRRQPRDKKGAGHVD